MQKGFMQKLSLVLLAACVLACAAVATAQDDSPSLGDVARQSRLQKQQKDAQAAKEAQTSAKAPDAEQANDASSAQPSKAPKKIITNDEIPSRFVSAKAAETHSAGADSPQKSGDQAYAEQVTSRVINIRNNIASLQSQITDLEQSIHYTGNNCVYGCAQWNENQQKKQQQIEALKRQLADQQQTLEDLQEAARKRGYGNSVTDP
jgi:hypothetical protein